MKKLVLILLMSSMVGVAYASGCQSDDESANKDGGAALTSDQKRLRVAGTTLGIASKENTKESLKSEKKESMIKITSTRLLPIIAGYVAGGVISQKELHTSLPFFGLALIPLVLNSKSDTYCENVPVEARTVLDSFAAGVLFSGAVSLTGVKSRLAALRN